MAYTKLFTRVNVVQMIRDEINEPTARIFSGVGTDSIYLDLDRFVDIGARVTSAITWCWEDQDETAFDLANDYVVSPSAAFIAVTGCEYEDYDATTANRDYIGLQRIPLEGIGHVCGATAGIPRFYAFFNQDIYFWPRVSSTIKDDGDKLRTSGFRCVTSFGNDGAETLPSELQIMPFYYAMSCVYARLGKHSLSAMHMKEFINGCNQWRYDVHGSIMRVDPYDVAKIADTTVTSQ